MQMETEGFQPKDIFNAARKYPPGEREAFLAVACAGNEELRREVETLLADEPNVGSFIEIPAIEYEAKLMAQAELLSAVEESQRLKKDYRLGRYQIIKWLARGGMGEVYLATDTRLNRKVALKLLPPEFAQDADRLRRFELEAKAASALNDPNIVTVHEIDEQNSIHFIVTEFIEGETLGQRLKLGRLALCDALDIAIQIASALKAAHAAEIVHRDIKPDNVMLRRDGLVKVLDFGIAKLMGPQEVDDDTGNRSEKDQAAGIENVTTPGMVVGTPGYLSPEQGRGMKVDARTDVFSLGVLIYEMIAGQRPPDSSPIAESLLQLAPQIPAGLVRITAQALHQEQGARQQSASEILVQLKACKEINSSVAADLDSDDEFNPLLSEWDFSPRIRDWLRRNPQGGLLALLASLSALVAILLSHYVGAASICISFQLVCDPKRRADLIFGYLVELNAGPLYLIGVPLVVFTGFHLLNFAHAALSQLASNHRFVVRRRNGKEGKLSPLAIIARYNRKLFRITIPLFVLFAITGVGIPEYRSLHQVAFGWVQALRFRITQTKLWNL